MHQVCRCWYAQYVLFPISKFCRTTSTSASRGCTTPPRWGACGRRLVLCDWCSELAVEASTGNSCTYNVPELADSVSHRINDLLTATRMDGKYLLSGLFWL